MSSTESPLRRTNKANKFALPNLRADVDEPTPTDPQPANNAPATSDTPVAAAAGPDAPSAPAGEADAVLPDAVPDDAQHGGEASTDEPLEPADGEEPAAPAVDTDDEPGRIAPLRTVGSGRPPARPVPLRRPDPEPELQTSPSVSTIPRRPPAGAHTTGVPPVTATAQATTTYTFTSADSPNVSGIIDAWDYRVTGDEGDRAQNGLALTKDLREALDDLTGRFNLDNKKARITKGALAEALMRLGIKHLDDPEFGALIIGDRRSKPKT